MPSTLARPRPRPPTELQGFLFGGDGGERAGFAAQARHRNSDHPLSGGPALAAASRSGGGVHHLGPSAIRWVID